MAAAAAGGPSEGTALQIKNTRALKWALRDICLLAVLIRKPKYRLKFWWVFGRFPAKLGPKTPLNGPGSKNGVKRT